MNTADKLGTFETIARELIAEVQAAKKAPVLTKMAKLSEIAENTPAVLLGMARELDRLSALHPMDGGGPASHSICTDHANTNAAPSERAGRAA